MFHLKYPKKSNFFTWGELGCLARALGYQVEIFQANITDEIYSTTEGVTLKEMMKMMDYKILQTVLHQTFNMHTADWNMCVIRKCLHLLNHKALMFEELHNIRIGYETYEAVDMKGMIINQHILLRALKMCGRMIAPMKLMHRIKHMKDDFEEKARIQLYEFLDLILWCDLYQSFQPNQDHLSSDKENKLFKLVDFERLLNHHDEKIAGLLNQKYIEEEMDFGHGNLGNKRNFKDPTVLTEDRIRRTQYHKANYKPLKSEINNSQKQVYQAKAGFVRPRPVTAPQLSHYNRKFSQQTMTETSVSEAYKMVQRRLRSAPPRSSRILPERPKTSQYHREATPPIVTPLQVKQYQDKLGSLQFAITTVKTRSEECLHEEMDYILPGYREKKEKDSKPVEIEIVKEPVKVVEKKKDKQAIVEELAHPLAATPVHHFRTCDARYRGWYNAGHKRGLHKVLIDSSFNEGQKGHFLKQLQTGLDNGYPKNYIYRYNMKKSFVPLKGRPKYRPRTAPASSRCSETMISTKQKEQKGQNNKKLQLEEDDRTIASSNLNDSASSNSSMKNDNDVSLSKTLKSPERSPERKSDKRITAEMKPLFIPVSKICTKPLSPETDYPLPVMKHSKPTIVEVGHIGRIKLLENIAESQDLEELLEEPTYNMTSAFILKAQDRNSSFHGDNKQESQSLEDEHVHSVPGSPNLSPKDYKEESPTTLQVNSAGLIEGNKSKKDISFKRAKSEIDIKVNKTIDDDKSEQFEPMYDPVSACHKSLSIPKSQNNRRSLGYIRLANRLNNDTNSHYIQKRLLSASSY
ncbi:hypothetical protein SNE40_003141 [Patella caerulea]|uniref:Uncharacterized protein n=1 Tax=Patella caerulea TaxID=87958 RepID=A0AAN8KFI1_PATCE